MLRHAPSALGMVGFLGALAFFAAGAFLGAFGLTALGFVTCAVAAASVPGWCHRQAYSPLCPISALHGHAAPALSADVAPSLGILRGLGCHTKTCGQCPNCSLPARPTAAGQPEALWPGALLHANLLHDIHRTG